MGRLRIERVETTTEVAVALSGELDVEAVPTFEVVMASEVASCDGDVHLDLSRLDFIGLAGVDALIALSRRMAVSHRRVDVTRSNALVDRVFEVLDVDLSSTSGRNVVPTGRPGRGPGGVGAHPGHDHVARASTTTPAPRITRRSDEFTITVTESQSQVVELAVAGELDSLTAPSLDVALDAVAHSGPTVAIVNMAGVTFMDSTAVRVLTDAERALRAVGGHLVLADPSSTTTRFLELSGLWDQIGAPAGA